MIDTHIHILPNVDDGSSSIEESVMMAKHLRNQGVTRIIATPHYRDGICLNKDVTKSFELAKNEFIKFGIDLYLGNEWYLSEEGYSDLKAEKVFTMASSQYLLVELPFYKLYPFHINLLYKVQVLGYKIIIAHVERYPYLFENEEKLSELLNKGMYLQLTTGFMKSRKARKLALKWIKKGYIHFIGSDGHNMTSRVPNMKEAYLFISKKLGEDTANYLFVESAKVLIKE